MIQLGDEMVVVGLMIPYEFHDRLPFPEPVRRWQKIRNTLDRFEDPFKWPGCPRDWMDEVSWVWRTYQRNVRINKELMTASEVLQSRLRTRRRNAIFKEDLMAECWHPKRVWKMVLDDFRGID